MNKDNTVEQIGKLGQYQEPLLEGHDYDIYKNYISRLLGVNMGVLDKWKKNGRVANDPGMTMICIRIT